MMSCQRSSAQCSILRFGIEFVRNKFRNILTSSNLHKRQLRNHSDPYLIWRLLYRLEGLWSISYMQTFISAAVLQCISPKHFWEIRLTYHLSNHVQHAFNFHFSDTSQCSE